MGEVYEVLDELLNERVALKTLRADVCHDSSLLRRFQTEIQLARKVTHPSICRLFEVGVHRFADVSRPELHFFTMQLLEGETLKGRIQRSGRLTSAEAFPFILQMAEGLQAAHDEGIIHRDFKSGNVILTKNRAVITDFGLAGLDPSLPRADSARTVSAEVRIAGTIAYMSPEQMSGGAVTPVSDIYSFGIVLFEMATGRLPFEDRHIIQSAMQRARGRIPVVRDIAPGIDPRWDFAIRRCLEVEPSRRFQSAADLASVFRDPGWSLPRVYWTRRLWGQIAAASVLSLGAWTYWIWSHRPYQPKPEALTWYQRGVDAFRAVTYEAARRDLEKAVATDPQYAPAHAYLGAVYSELDMSERANESILKALSIAQEERLEKLDALRVRALQSVISRDFEHAQPLFEQLRAAATATEKPGAYLELAWLALKGEDNPRAVPLLQQALKIDPALAGAKLRLASVMDRLGKKDDAQKLFEEAESLFNTASNYDGVAETLLQRAISLGKANRTGESEVLIGRAMALAVSTGDVYHQLRLQLVLALAYRNTGRTAQSKDIAERGIKMAIDNRMDAVAAIGLLDLGNAYLLRGEPEPAKSYYEQGLDLATRSRARFSEARAHFSLGMLYLQYDRPLEVSQQVQPALTFFRTAGYRKEWLQALLVLGGSQESLANFNSAENTLRGAIRLAEQIDDAEQAGLAHLYLGSVLAKTGHWPESLTERNQALHIFGDMRGGYRAAHTLAARGRLLAQMGRFEEASADLAQARARVEKLEGKQAQLRARLELGNAEIAYFKTRWWQAIDFARLAVALNGGTDENVQAAVLTGLAMIRTGSIREGLAVCDRAIRQIEEKSRPYQVAESRLLLAHALWETGEVDEASSLAREALALFEPRQIWEPVWRCRRMLASADDLRAARIALDELKRSWPEEMVGSYLGRPDLKKLALR
jgi:tetratricopeptide (TPR) repeat protein